MQWLPVGDGSRQSCRLLTSLSHTLFCACVCLCKLIQESIEPARQTTTIMCLFILFHLLLWTKPVNKKTDYLVESNRHRPWNSDTPKVLGTSALPPIRNLRVFGEGD